MVDPHDADQQPEHPHEPKHEPATRAEPTAGIACPTCGCRDLPVYYTRRARDKTMRRRRCRHCGRMLTTFERLG